MKPRRILIFSLAYYPRFVGGAEVAVKEITDRISESELEFDMITLGDGRGLATEKIGNINVHRIFKNSGNIQKLLFPFFAAFKAKKLHLQRKYDAIWSIMASYAGYAGMIFKRNNRDIPFILTIQEGENFGRRTLLKPLFRKIFIAADRIQVISNFLANWARTMGAKCPIDLVPNAVDVDLFSKKTDEGAAIELKNKLGKKENDVFLITTSRLVPKNAVGDIISALEYLPNNVKLLVLGTGREETKLKVQASKLDSLSNGSLPNGQTISNMQSRVQFLGYIPHSEMPKYLQISEIFVRPSLTEGLGNSFLEAMAAGIPVIGTAVGGIPDFLKDGETGLFCDVHNPKSIAKKVEKLMKDRESREYIIRRAKETVSGRFQWGKVAEKMKDTLIAK